MTAADMKTRIEEGLDKPEAPGYEDAEISRRLTDAQLEFINWMNQNGEETVTKADFFSTITKMQEPLVPSGNNWSFPLDYHIARAVYVDVEIAACPGKTLEKQESVLTSHYKLGSRQDDTDAVANGYFPRHWVSQDGITILTGPDNQTGAYMTYVKRPADIVVDSVTPANDIDAEIPPRFHTILVGIVVRGMLENVEQPRYTTYLNDLKTQIFSIS